MHVIAPEEQLALPVDHLLAILPAFDLRAFQEISDVTPLEPSRGFALRPDDLEDEPRKMSDNSSRQTGKAKRENQRRERKK